MFFSRSGFFLLFLVFCLQAFAQDSAYWRPITEFDRAIKEPQVEKDADAEALFWEVKADDSKSNKVAYEHYVRVKVFTERGRERFAKIDIPVFKGKKVENVAARVTKADGTAIFLKPEDIFEREIARSNNRKYKAISFAISGIEPGAIVEYQYKEVFKNNSVNGDRIFFQKDIPLRKISYFVKPAKGFVLNNASYNLPQNVGFEKSNDGFFVASMENVAAFKEEPFMPPDLQVKPWMMLYYSSFFSTDTWPDLARRLSMGSTYLFKPDKDITRLANEVTAGAQSQSEKLKRIYDYCQKRIKNLSYDRTLTEEQRENIEIKKVEDVIKRGAGSSGFIDWLFIALARSQNFDARIVLAGDRSEYFFDPNINRHSSFVSITSAAVKLDGVWKYFKPGVPYLPFGQLPWWEEGVSSILITDGTYDVTKSTFLDQQSSKSIRKAKLRLSADGTLEGDISYEYSGQEAIRFRSGGFFDTEDKRKEDFKERLKARLSTIEVSDISIENFGSVDLPLIYRAKVKVPNYATITGKRIFLQPNFFENGVKPIFSAATRQYPIYFIYPWSEDDKIDISIPAGYEVETIDNPNNIEDSAKLSFHRIKLQSSPDKTAVNYERQFYFGADGKLLVPVKSYQGIRNLFDLHYNAANHAITLKQK